VDGTILQVEERLMAAFLRFEILFIAKWYSKRPLGRPVPVPGDSSAQICLRDVQPRMLVLCSYLDGEEYRATCSVGRENSFESNSIRMVVVAFETSYG
jgi:hypothetical protein